MAQKNNALIVLGSLVVIGSVGYYLYTKSKKPNGAGSSEPTPDGKPPIGGGTNEPPKDTPKDTPKTNPPKQEVVPPLLATTDLVKKFQDWMDTNYPTWLKGKKLDKKGGYGTRGPSTKSAWDSYGVQYEKAQKVADTRSKFKEGQFVTAKRQFIGYASNLRNGKWVSTDGTGVRLPQKTYNATADLGYVKAILNNGYIILTVPREIGPTYGTRIYTEIFVSPNNIE
jgi:hypothetical protein